jgi:hypothetical protein
MITQSSLAAFRSMHAEIKKAVEEIWPFYVKVYRLHPSQQHVSDIRIFEDDPHNINVYHGIDRDGVPESTDIPESLLSNPEAVASLRAKWQILVDEERRLAKAQQQQRDLQSRERSWARLQELAADPRFADRVRFIGVTPDPKFRSNQDVLTANHLSELRVLAAEFPDRVELTGVDETAV